MNNRGLVILSLFLATSGVALARGHGGGADNRRTSCTIKHNASGQIFVRTGNKFAGAEAMRDCRAWATTKDFDPTDCSVVSCGDSL